MKSISEMASALKIYGNRRMILVLVLGFSSGIPLALTAGTLQAWLTKSGVDIKTIGLFALVGMPYTLKFIWAPLMDKYYPNFWGRRRSWMLLTQIALVLTIMGLGMHDPTTQISSLVILAICVAFFSSSQDMVIDAYRTEILNPDEYGAGSGVYILGYRLAMIVSGSMALVLADHMSWREVYFIMAGMMSLGVLATFFAEEPKNTKEPKTFQEAVIDPFIDFFSRAGAIEVAIFIMIYKLDVAIATALQSKFFLDLGFTLTQIGSIVKLFGMWSVIFGALTGGMLIPQLGLKRSLIWFGIFQCATNMLFYMMAKVGPDEHALMLTIALENFSAGMGTAAFSAFLMSLCNKKFTLTQYALLTSLMAVPMRFLSAPTGYLKVALGWDNYFVFATLIGIPGLLMLLRFDTWKAAPHIASAGAGVASEAET